MQIDTYATYSKAQTERQLVIANHIAACLGLPLPFPTTRIRSRTPEYRGVWGRIGRLAIDLEKATR